MPLCEAQKQVVRIRGGTRALVTSMSREVENFNETLHDKTQEEISVLLNDWERRSTRPRTTLRQLNQRFESSEDTNEPLTAPEWENEIANREDYERKLDLIEELVANLRGKQDPSTLDPLLGKTESDSAKNDPATDTSMAQLLEQLIKVQQLSANTAALQQLPQVNVRKFGGDTVEFLQFWNEFKSTVQEKESLADVVKFRQLRQLLIGEAAAAIEAIPVTNYLQSCGLLDPTIWRCPANHHQYFHAFAGNHEKQRAEYSSNHRSSQQRYRNVAESQERT